MAGWRCVHRPRREALARRTQASAFAPIGIGHGTGKIQRAFLDETLGAEQPAGQFAAQHVRYLIEADMLGQTQRLTGGGEGRDGHRYAQYAVAKAWHAALLVADAAGQAPAVDFQ